jgi:hypothetical protein
MTAMSRRGGRITPYAPFAQSESCDPKTNVKVAALANGQAVVLWEGQPARGQALRVFVIRPITSVQAQSLIIHMDNALAPSWNEIDAVELVGRDGSRQSASIRSVSCPEPQDVFG